MKKWTPQSKKIRQTVRCFLITLLVTWSAFTYAGQSMAQTDVTSSYITGTLLVIWGNSSIDTVKYTLTDSSRQTTLLIIDDDLVRLAGGAMALNKKYLSVQGFWGESLYDQSVSPVFHVTTIIPPSLARVLSVAKAAEPAVSGTKNWVTIMCKFSDSSIEPENQTFFKEMYSGVKPGLDHYWRELSYDSINIGETSTAAGWFVLPDSVPDYNPTGESGGTDLSRLAKDCIAAADSSVDFSSFDAINMVFNTDFNDSAWGGNRYMTLDGVSKLWGTLWIPPWGYGSISVIAHEMGHSLGLPHSSGAYGQTYDNVWDVMSSDRDNCAAATDPTYGCMAQHTIAYHKDLLGWIPADHKYIGDGIATITLDNLALFSTTNYRMAQLPINGSETHFYTVEARQLSGYDSKLPGKAVIIHEVDTTRTRPAHIVDIDENGDTGDAGAMWIVGEMFTDVDNNISVNILSATENGFQISIAASLLPPATPSIPSATDGTYGDRVQISWESVAEASSYKIYRCTDTMTDSCLYLSETPVSPYDDNDAEPGVYHYYRVKAVGVAGDSGFSVYDSGYRPVTTPAKPAASDGAFSSYVQISWDDVRNATYYKVYRCTDTFTESCSYLTWDNLSPYNDYSATSGVQYYYRIKASAGTGDSSYSEADAGSVMIVKPGSLQVSWNTYTDHIASSWNEVVGAEYYVLYRSDTSGITGNEVYRGSENSWDDYGTAMGISYYYSIMACDGNGCSSLSYQQSGYYSLNQPATISASWMTWNDRIVVDWASVDGAEFYRLSRSLEYNQNYLEIYQGENLQFTDSTAEENQNIYYRVTACNSQGCSVSGNTATGAWSLPVVDSLNVTNGEYDDKIAVSWDTVAGSSHYQLYRSQSWELPGNLIYTGTAESFDDKNVVAEMTYYYHLAVCNARGCGSTVFASGYRIRPVPLAPEALNASDGLYPDFIQISWDEIVEADYYQLFAVSSSGQQDECVYGGSENAFDDYRSSEEVIYYSVQACNSRGCSELSREDSGYVKRAEPEGMGRINPGIIFMLLR